MGVFWSIIFSLILPLNDTSYNMSFLEVCLTVFLNEPQVTNEPRFADSSLSVLIVALKSFKLSNLINLSKSLQSTPSIFSLLLKNLVVMSGGGVDKLFNTYLAIVLSLSFL